ncbi:MAG TPA: hypothetical protein VMJ90_05475 [Anaerolineales bacterium]|nr:hypothetical protein [Anaerolineales bacterium]
MKTKIVSAVSYFIPRFRDALFILLFFSVLAGGSVLLNTDGDLPRHLLMGRNILETGKPPTTEIFSYPYAGREYVPHEWLAGVIFYLSWLVFDLNGVVVLAGTLIGAAFLLIFIQSYLNSRELLLSFLLVLLGAVVTSIHWLARPHLFTMVFLAIWLILIDRLARGKQNRIGIFPLVMLFWANIHAEYIVGFLVLLAYLAGCGWSYLIERNTGALATLRSLLVIFLLSFIVSLVNPAGLKAWTTVAGYINNEYLMSRITETQQPDFLDTDSLPLLGLLVISGIVIAGNRTRFTPVDIFLITGFGLMCVISARNAHLFGVTAPLVLSRGLNGIRVPKSIKNVEAMIARLEAHARGGPIPVIISLLAGLFFLAHPQIGSHNRFDPAVFPVDAVQWLGENPQTGQMFNAFDWGGYILFHLWPSQQVFIESQTDTTGDLTRMYETVVTLDEGWGKIFDQYDIRLVLIPPDWTLASELKNQGWVVTYKDATAVILVEK